MHGKKKKFKYKPLSLKDILREMKQSIDSMIDLAYSAIKFGSKEIADEASKIEKRIHELTFLLNLQIIQTKAGGVKEAKKLVELLHITFRGHILELQLLEEMFPTKKSGIVNPNIKQLKDFFSGI